MKVKESAKFHEFFVCCGAHNDIPDISAYSPEQPHIVVLSAVCFCSLEYTAENALFHGFRTVDGAFFRFLEWICENLHQFS